MTTTAETFDLTAPLTAKQREELEATLAWINKLLARAATFQKTLLERLKLQSKLLVEIAELEKLADGGDREASKELVAANDQARRLANTVKSKQGELLGLLPDFERAATVTRNEIRAAHRPVRERHEKQVAELLSPLCRSQEEARQYGQQLASVGCLLYFSRNHPLAVKFADGEAAAAALTTLAETIQRMLAKEPVIHFTGDADCMRFPAFCS